MAISQLSTAADERIACWRGICSISTIFMRHHTILYPTILRHRVFQRFILLLLLIALAEPSMVSADTHHVITQSTYSDCGPAALATLLTYYLDIPASEKELMKLAEVDPQYGTTFLKLEKAATAKGCSAESFRMDYATLREQMRTYPGPVIVRTFVPEPHFSVLLGIRDKNVFLADPSHGNIVLRESAFLQRWLIPGVQQGFLLIVAAPDEHLNQAGLDETIDNLIKQMRHVEQIRPPLIPYR